MEQKYHVNTPLGILCNPRGGRSREDPDEIRRLAEGISDSRYREASTPAAIQEALSELLEAGPGALVFIGGDGTLQAALTALHALRPPEGWPVLAALPGGTTNMTAKDLGSWPTVEEGLRALGEGWVPRSGGPEGLVRRPVLHLAGGGIDGVCGMFLGVGGIAEGIRAWNQDFQREDLPGDGAIRLTIARLIWRLASRRGGREELTQPLTAAVDGEEGRSHRTLLGLVTSLHRLILNTRPYWGSEPDPLHVTLVESDARGLLWRLPLLALGRAGRSLTPERGYRSLNVRRIELTLDGPVVVDGELFQARAAEGPVRVTAIPEVDWLVP